MINEIQMENFLANYDASEPQNFRGRDIKKLFSKKGREELIEEIKDKHPKLKASLDKHPGLEKAVKAAMAYEAAMIGVGAVAAVGAGVYFSGGALAEAGGLAVFKPAMQAVLKSKGESTNGLPLKDIAAKFMKSKGKSSTGVSGDYSFISDYFGEKMDKLKREGGSPEDQLINNLIDGTVNTIKDKGADFVNDLITGNDAAPGTPLANPDTSKKDDETKTGDKKNMLLIFGAIVLIVIFAARK